jgi:flavin reductase (DIM6/NTAB) family NADH-FMN oxidoreductase RutF
MVGFVLSSPTFALGADDASSPETSKASPGPAFRFAGEVGVERLEEDLYLPLALKFGADLPVPQLGCRWPGAEEGACETRLQFGLHTPVRLRISDRAPEQSGVLRDEDWDELGDYLRFVRFVSYGRPSKPVYARLGELGSLVLGHGTIVNGYYNVVTPKPPVVMFSVSPPDDKGDKDTLRNIRETGEFVCNLVTEPLVEAMDATSAPIPSDESEFDAAGLEHEPSVAVDPPRVASAEVTMECRLYDELSVFKNDVVLGEVTRFHIDDHLLTDGKIDVRKVRAVGRLCGDYYASLDLMDFERSH